MITRHFASLPTELQRPLAWQPFNTKPVLPVSNRDAFTQRLRTFGMPPTREPALFLSQLLELEQAGGTEMALLAGMLAVTGTNEFPLAAEYIRIYDDLAEAFMPTVKDRTNPESYFEALELPTQFDSSTKSFGLALENMRKNLNGSFLGTGNCVFGATFAALLLLRQGFEACEFRSIRMAHPAVGLSQPDNTFLIYDLQPHGSTWKHAPATLTTVISNPLSLIASACVGDANELLIDADKTVPAKGITETALNELALAREINPFSYILFRDLAKAYRAQGRKIEAVKTEFIAIEINNWIYQMKQIEGRY
jgi:hypothetical protein